MVLEKKEKKELQKQPHKQGRNTTTPHRKDRSGILGLNRGLCYCKLLIVYIKLDCIKLHTQKNTICDATWGYKKRLN